MNRWVLKLYELSGSALAKEYVRALKRTNAVFIWIPKTAGTSLVKAMGLTKVKSRHLMKYYFVNRGTVTFGHMDYAGLVEKGRIAKHFDARAFKFAFSRNPYDRAVSLFFFFKKQGKLPTSQSFKSFWQRIAVEGCEPIGAYNVRGFSQCNPQLRWIERIDMDFIGSYETLQEDVEQLMRRLKLSGQGIPHLNRSTHADYRRYYDSESQEIIRRYYQEDFRYFGYDEQRL